jgi:hypothetical protein
MSVSIHPQPQQTGREDYLRARIAIHLCIRKAQEEQPPEAIGTADAAASCLKAVISDQ